MSGLDNIKIPNFVEGAIQTNALPLVIRQVETQLLRKVFNMQNVAIVTEKEKIQVPTLGYERDAKLRDSVIGTPILTDLTLKSVKYVDNDGIQFVTPDIILETVLLTINQTKNIVKTQIQGKNGTVKEYIGMGDYNVTISAIISAPNGMYPKQSLLNIKEMLTAPVSIPVVNWWLQTFDIYYLTIESFDIGQVEGGYSYQPMSISCLSDEIVQLRLS